MTTTCQICGRDIKSNTGLIAHHGYQRPHRGSGWQTASCFGARWRPYEVACDAIPPAIEHAKQFVVSNEMALTAMIEHPADSYTYEPKRHGYPTGEKILIPRPANFDTSDRPATTRPRTYENHYWGLRREVEYNIENGRRDIAALETRLAEWRAPVTLAKCG